MCRVAPQKCQQQGNPDAQGEQQPDQPVQLAMRPGHCPAPDRAARSHRRTTTGHQRDLHLLGRFAQFDYINSDVCVERALALADKLRAE